jgi:hypothetical protein
MGTQVLELELGSERDTGLVMVLDQALAQWSARELASDDIGKERLFSTVFLLAIG